MKKSLSLPGWDIDAWNKRVRIAFWVLGSAAGAVLTYASRYYINADGINYVEMGEALRQGQWSGLINTTESPGYAFLLGIGQMLLNTNPLNEVPLLKLVNFVCFLVTMGACDLFVTSLRSRVDAWRNGATTPLPFPVLSALAYSMFLSMALCWVRVRLVAPDMMVFAWFLVAMWSILWIRDHPNSYEGFVLLGLSSGLAFLFKTFFFLYSVVFFVFSGLAVGSLRRAAPRVALAVCTMLAVSSPLLVGLSREVGRFSYGEVGNYGYIYNLAGEGEPIHQPQVVHDKPPILLYRDGPGKTCPAGYDLAYWTLGMKKVFNASIHWKVLVENVAEFFGYVGGLLAATLAWLLIQWRIGALSAGGFRPLSIQWLLLLPALPGIGLYVLMHVEPRYLAPFVFVAFVALTLLPRYHITPGGRAPFAAVVTSCCLVVFVLVGVAQAVVDQSYRGLFPQGGKLSHRQMYQELFAIVDFLKSKDIGPGAEVGVVGHEHFLPVYWARMGGIRITVGVPDERAFLGADPQERLQAIGALKKNGIRALLAKGPFISPILTEGWESIPGARDYYVIFP